MLADWFVLGSHRDARGSHDLRCTGPLAEVLRVDDGTTMIVRTREPPAVHAPKVTTCVLGELGPAFGLELQAVALRGDAKQTAP